VSFIFCLFSPLISQVWGDTHCPAHTTIRLWPLRYGLDRLNSPKNLSGDVSLLSDHTVKAGSTKCLIAVAVSLDNLRKRNDYTLKFSDLTPLIIYPQLRSTALLTKELLEKAANNAGVKYFASTTNDAAADLKKGAKLYSEVYEKTKNTIDITHKKGTIIKSSLENDGFFNEFSRLYNQTKQLLKQSEWAALAPSHQRKKGRYLNIDIMIKWAKFILNLIDKGDEFPIPHGILEKIRWVCKFRTWIEDVEQRIVVCEIAESQLIAEGLHCKSAVEYKKKISERNFAREHREISKKVEVFLREQGKGIPKAKPVLGCTNILESLIGKVKSLDSGPSKRDFGSRVLLHAVVVSEPTPESVKEALERTTTDDLLDWAGDFFKKSIDYVRRKISGNKCQV